MTRPSTATLHYRLVGFPSSKMSSLLDQFEQSLEITVVLANVLNFKSFQSYSIRKLLSLNYDLNALETKYYSTRSPVYGGLMHQCDSALVLKLCYHI